MKDFLTPRLITRTVLAAALVLFALYVWPTAWKEYRVEGEPLRVHRITGKTQSLTPQGWLNTK